MHWFHRTQEHTYKHMHMFTHAQSTVYYRVHVFYLIARPQNLYNIKQTRAKKTLSPGPDKLIWDS